MKRSNVIPFEAFSTLLHSWGHDTPQEVIWGLNEAIEFYKENNIIEKDFKFSFTDPLDSDDTEEDYGGMAEYFGTDVDEDGGWNDYVLQALKKSEREIFTDSNYPKVALDVDGVIANYHEAMRVVGGKPKGIVYNDWHIDWITNAYKTIKDKSLFWKTLPVLNSPDKLDFTFDLYLTAIPGKFISEREVWLKENNFPNKPCIAEYDKLKYALDNDIKVLIDDKLETVELFNSNGLIGIHYNPYYLEKSNSKYSITCLSEVKPLINKLILEGEV